MRTLTISVEPEMKATMEQFVQRAERGIATGQYQGETLNFATPALFFSRLSAHRWNIITHLMNQGTVGVRELARRLGRDPKRVLEDTKVLVELGLLEKTAKGALHCPYARINIDMTLVAHTLAPDSNDMAVPAIDPVVAAQHAQSRAKHSARHAGA